VLSWRDPARRIDGPLLLPLGQRLTEGPRTGTGVYPEEHGNRSRVRVVCRRCRRNEAVRGENIPDPVGGELYV